MNIAWTYLDKRSAAANALKDYVHMDFIIRSHPDRTLESHSRMTAIHVPGLSGMPHHSDPLAAETQLVAAIDEIDIAQERYRQALEYMEWFQPAWERLKEDEQFVLEEFYQDADERTVDGVLSICNHFHIERSSAYNKKNRALAKLALLLYGK